MPIASTLWDALLFLGGALSCSDAGICSATGGSLDGASFLFGGVCVSAITLVCACACAIRSGRRSSWQAEVRMNAPYRAPRHGSMLLMLALLIGPLLLPSSGSVRSSRIQSAAPATANASDALTRLLPPSLQLASVDADFYERSVEAPGDAQPYASMLARVARTRRVSIGVVGGSASVRGGCPRCAPGSGLASGAAMRSCAMHGGFQDWVARWFQEELGAVATVHDGGQSGSGPAMPMLCLESLLGTSAAVGDGLDLLLVEFAVNAAPRCDVSGAELERLLWRLRDYAPSAAILGGLVRTRVLFDLYPRKRLNHGLGAEPACGQRLLARQEHLLRWSRGRFCLSRARRRCRLGGQTHRGDRNRKIVGAQEIRWQRHGFLTPQFPSFAVGPRVAEATGHALNDYAG